LMIDLRRETNRADFHGLPDLFGVVLLLFVTADKPTL
jgi:hypothetical protein